jgi:hypothetical protein
MPIACVKHVATYTRRADQNHFALWRLQLEPFWKRCWEDRYCTFILGVI